MADSHPSGGDIFDLERLTRLVELMKQHDLSEVDLQQDEQRIRLRRGGEAPVAATPVSPAPPPVAAPPLPVAAVAAAPTDGPNIVYIKSPMVGTFYSRPNPNAESFVKVGEMVGPEKTVCIIEAMKVFNEIAAEVSGRIVAILAEDEEPVDFGRPLFKVDTGK